MNELTKQIDLKDSLLAPGNSEHYYKIATNMSKAQMVPKCYFGKPNDLFLAMALGYKLGYSPEQAAQNIVVINGKPCVYGDALLALVMVHPAFEDIIEEAIEDDEHRIIGYTCTIKRKNRKDIVRKFTLEQAAKAGLIKRSQVWQSYPERMLQMRARGYAIRDGFPDALHGLMPAEEVSDYYDAEYEVIKKTRTENLKDELSLEDNDTVLPQETVEPGQENAKTDAVEEVVKNEPQETQSGNETNEDRKTQLLGAIDQQMELLDFTHEGLSKVCSYYGVSYIPDMTEEQLEHLHAQLERKLDNDK